MMRLGDCIEVLKTLSDNSVDSLVTDPPAGIGFMGKDWDHHKGGRDQWVSWMTGVMRECLRVMKPGAHGLVWALPRTSHWTATALENAGFEVRDVVTHLFGTGFPKSLDISKAIDKHNGISEWKETTPNPAFRARQLEHDAKWDTRPRPPKPVVETDEAKQWQGWGTALKPASEHWILVRKPCSEKTVAANVLKYGTGGINIDACRIGIDPEDAEKIDKKSNSPKNYSQPIFGQFEKAWSKPSNPQGRFPANLVLDEVAAEMLDKGGGASRFFYCAKASKSDRGTDNKHPTVKSTKLMQYLITLVSPPNGIVLDPFTGSGSTGVAAKALGFEFIGIEQNQEYFEIASKRLGA